MDSDRNHFRKVRTIGLSNNSRNSSENSVNSGNEAPENPYLPSKAMATYGAILEKKENLASQSGINARTVLLNRCAKKGCYRWQQTTKKKTQEKAAGPSNPISNNSYFQETKETDEDAERGPPDQEPAATTSVLFTRCG